MKIIINESNIKNVFKRLNIDLSGKIQMVTNSYELPMEFAEFFTPQILRVYFNNYGPMFVIKSEEDVYLYQHQGKLRTLLINVDGDSYSESQFLSNILNIPPMGISLQDVLDTFFEEDN